MEQIAVAPWESLVITGFSKNKEAAQKTARNKICNGTFPFTLKEIEGTGRKVVLVADILAALGVTTPTTTPAASVPPPAETTTTTSKKVGKVGRRTNAEKAGLSHE